MLPVHKLHLESARYIRHPDNAYPAVELTIGGKKAYLIEVMRPYLVAGFAEIIDIYDHTRWYDILPKIKVSPEDMKKHGLPKTLLGVTTGPRIVAIAKQFWDDINTPHGFQEGKRVFP